MNKTQKKYFGYLTSDETRKVKEMCSHLTPDYESIPPPTPEEILAIKEQHTKCIEENTLIIAYSKIQHLCIGSEDDVEDDRFLDIKAREWVNCDNVEPTEDEYIAEFGFNPHETCFHCEHDQYGKMIDVRSICNPCNPCVDYSYDGDCNKIRTHYLVFDAKQARYWRHPTTKEVLWKCEMDAIRAWESDVPPKSAGKQQLSFYDPTKKEGNICPKYKSSGDAERDKNLPKIPNNFKWCVPRWNDQCRYYIVLFTENISANDFTIRTNWKFLNKCNQEECDLAGRSGLNQLARHAEICDIKCYDLNPRYAKYPAWTNDLVNYEHRNW